jgi:hypothetical protein
MRNSKFFANVRQIDLEVGGQPGKMPTFYYDGALMTGLFPAHHRALRELIPDPDLEPARLAPGLGALVLWCIEYRDSDIGAYNEVAIGVALNEPDGGPNLPGRALLAAVRRRQQHVYIHHLPVTTEVSRRGGIDFYNFPKFLADIEFRDERGRRRCELSQAGERILTFTGERLESGQGAQVDVFAHLWMDGQPQTAQLKVNQLELGRARLRRVASLELGDHHPIARELGRLLASKMPLQYEHCPRFEAILFGPQHLTPALARRVIDASEALEQAEATRH